MHKWKKCNTYGDLCLLQFLDIISLSLYIDIYTHYRSATYISSIQLLSRVQLFATPWTAARQASLSITNSWSLLKLMSIALVMPSNHFILCRPLLLPPSIFPSIGVFSNESEMKHFHVYFCSFLYCGGYSIYLFVLFSLPPECLRAAFLEWIRLLQQGRRSTWGRFCTPDS